MSNLPLDAKIVLLHLNALGYRNITSEQLKEFMKDLKKLIKYDAKMEAQGFRVASKTTVSSRSKSREKVKSSSSTENEEEYFIQRRFNGVRRSRSAKSSGEVKERSRSASKKMSDQLKNKENQAKTSERSRSPRDTSAKSESTKASKSSNRSKFPSKSKDSSAELKKKILEDSEKPETQKLKETNPEARPYSRPSARSNGSSKGCKDFLILEVRMILIVLILGIRTKVPQKPPHGDPVALYQYYKKEWEKFKPCFPGENSWTDLRWEIRNKLKNQH